MYFMQTPVSVQWDQRNGKGDAYNVDTGLYPFARAVTGDAPEQINLQYQVSDSPLATTQGQSNFQGISCKCTLLALSSRCTNAKYL